MAVQKIKPSKHKRVIAPTGKNVQPVMKSPLGQPNVEREPLMLFSFYLSGRSNVLLDTADEILSLLDKGFSGRCLNKNNAIGRADTLMWLWTLGAYEVIRTMCQAKPCFSEIYYQKIYVLKKKLASARMPAAKMEKTGKHNPVSSNRSPSGWDVKNKDLIVGDPEDQDISARELIENYKLTITSLTISDVVKHHIESYK